MLKTKNKFNIITIISIIIITLICPIFAGCSKDNSSNKDSNNGISYPLKIVDSYNRTVKLDKDPKRIITIAPNITEIIYSLGCGNKIVGRSDFDDFPNDVNKIPSIGTLTNPSLEKIVELKPDVVIASDFFSKDIVKKLENLNIKIIVLYGEENLNGVYDTINKVGIAINAKAKAETLVSNMKDKVSKIKDKTKNAKKPSVYYVLGYGKAGDYTAGKDTFVGNMIETAGGKNAADDVNGWNYNVEKLVEKNPDILICSNKYDSKKGIEATNGYKDLKAVKEGRLLEIDENLISRPGPRVVDGLEALAKMIHPELFK